MSRTKWIGIAAATMVISLGAWRWLRHPETQADDAEAAGGEVVTAAVVKTQRGAMENTLTIAGEFKPFQDVDVHAKVAGYIKKIYVDVGDHVKQGQTLAILDVPELTARVSGADAALRRAKEDIRREQGDLERAESAHGAAHAVYTRLKQASEQQKGLVAQQELDEAQAKDLEAEAQVSSAQAALSAAEQQVEMSLATEKQYGRATAAVFLSIPLSALATFLAIGAGGGTVNTMVLGGKGADRHACGVNGSLRQENRRHRSSAGAASRTSDHRRKYRCDARLFLHLHPELRSTHGFCASEPQGRT